MNRGEKPGSTRSYPMCKYPVLPRGILNNRTWSLHVAFHKDAVITISIYYLVSSEWNDPFTYSYFVRLPDPQSLSFTSKLKFFISENANFSQNEQIACTW